VAAEAVAEDPLEPFRSELRAHCYRMLGSVHDAEDALQEVSLRAWRGRQDFEGRASLRTWLHRIATNACLNELDRKERRVLPVEFGPAAEAGTALYESLDEALWLEPLPDDAAMATTSASVRSALQRARRLLEERLPERSQYSTLAALGDAGQRKLVARYTAALQQHDVEGMLALLTEDATWSMPPMPAWFRGHDAIAGFLAEAPFRVRWRHRPARANGQLAVGCFAWDEAAGAFRAYALDVLDLRGDRIATIVSFIGGERFPAFGLPPAIFD
jgi:RNA polymerase sigma-70 factor (ECF subfamily)